MKLIDMQVIGAMRPPDGSSNTLSGRFIRHFNTLNIDLFTDTTIASIFSRIVLWHLDTKGFSKEFDPCIEQAKLSSLYSKDIYLKLRFNLKGKSVFYPN